MHRTKAGDCTPVTSERYQHLLGLLFDADLSDAEARELSAAISSSPELKMDLQEELIRWDLWSQQQAPERSAIAFVDAWKTRLSAEDGAESFSNSVLSHLGDSSAPVGFFGRTAAWLTALAARPAASALRSRSMAASRNRMTARVMRKPCSLAGKQRAGSPLPSTSKPIRSKTEFLQGPKLSWTSA